MADWSPAETPQGVAESQWMKNERKHKMKFETISEYEILNHAYFHIMEKWLDRIEKNDEFKKEHGRENKIDRHWIDKYNEQLNELHEAICKLEQAETRA